jgi:hypothetical protein
MNKEKYAKLMDALVDHAEFAKNGETSEDLRTIFSQIVSTIDSHNLKWLDAQINLPGSPFCDLLRRLKDERRRLWAARRT